MDLDKKERVRLLEGQTVLPEQWGIPPQRRRLRVLVVGQRNSFQHILITNIRRWNYEVLVVEAKSSHTNHSQQNSDIVLYDLDEVLSTLSRESSCAAIGKEECVDEVARYLQEQRVNALLPIVFSNLSLSRKTLSTLGVAAVLQKPFEMGHLQRYLDVFQELVFPERRRQEYTNISCLKRVLVVDDDADIAQTICHYLTLGTGFEVRVASDGLEAILCCLEWQPHCIVIDVILPWMNGYQVMHCLSVGSLRLLPRFVVMSALLHHEHPVQSPYFTGANVSYIEKPFHMSHLLTAVQHICTCEGENPAGQG